MINGATARPLPHVWAQTALWMVGSVRPVLASCRSADTPEGQDALAADCSLSRAATAPSPCQVPLTGFVERGDILTASMPRHTGRTEPQIQDTTPRRVSEVR